MTVVVYSFDQSIQDNYRLITTTDRETHLFIDDLHRRRFWNFQLDQHACGVGIIILNSTIRIIIIIVLTIN